VGRGEAHGGAQALEDRDTVRTSLAKFDLETQQAVIHYYLDEMTLEEISRVLERSVPTIRKRLRAFASQTGEALRSDDPEAP
jgi:RNA polymerase sigma-70 factor (ECF subfamily)